LVTSTALDVWARPVRAGSAPRDQQAGRAETRARTSTRRVRAGELLLEDWAHTQHKLADTEQRMVAVLDKLELTALVTSITGISAVGAATILAETGDPNRFATARALVKHAGLAPREKSSGTFTGRTKLTGQGRPRLRVAAWRTVVVAAHKRTAGASPARH
jgi:transposase